MNYAMVGANNVLKGRTTFLLLSSSRPLLPSPLRICFHANNNGFRVPPPAFSRHAFPSSFHNDLSHRKLAVAFSGRRRGGFFSQCSYSDSTAATTSSSKEEDDNSASSASRSVDSSSANQPMLEIKDAANTLDIRVGKILRAWKHDEADSLYVEEVDIGEPQPRIICSGLVNYVPLQHLQDRHVIVLANLKPRNMRGVKSCGMLMAASDESHQNVELLLPPEGSVPGERVWFGLDDEKDKLPEAATPNQVQKKKIWELVQPHLKTNDTCVAMLGSYHMRAPAGLVVCSSLANARVS
nr:aminoacyl tRNA synthase complex-interacting multifunctional protein 1 [Ipomoea batatas]GMD05975.1 aminoacyl tRNA synthase complex-interacting multifunctional protein 1 [Ipomoea batatas]